VKWFNLEKGFGFVELADGSGDAFLHAAVLERAGHGAVDPGATVEVRAGPGKKGMQVTEVLSIDSSTATQEPAQRARPERPAPSRPAGPLVQETGTVKFYNAAKGYGFIGPDRGGKDVFVHASALNRARILSLADGQRVTMDVVEGRKGPEAAEMRLSDRKDQPQNPEAEPRAGDRAYGSRRESENSVQDNLEGRASLHEIELGDDALAAILKEHGTWVESGGVAGVRAELAGTRLSGRAFWRADLRRADLSGADLRRCNLDHALMSGATLTRADLGEASLWQADLAGACLGEVNFQGAKLDHADLRGADLRGADLGRASVWGAHVEGTDLHETIGLVPEQLSVLRR
jgi:CspA family cold shock protein